MTAPAAIKQSEMTRLAAVANANKMTIEVVVDGKIFRFIPGIHSPNQQDDEPIDRGKDIVL